MILKAFITILLILLIAGTAVVIIYDNGDSGRKLAWLLIIALLPIVGLVLYFCIGINLRHHIFFKRRHERYEKTFQAGTDERVNRLLFDPVRTDRLPEEYRPLARLLASQSNLTVSEGNDFEIITTGKRKYELLMEDLRNAKESIHMEYFHFGNDTGSREIKHLLMEKAKEGVEVRFINENIANFPISSLYYDDMKKAGVQVEKFTNPRYHLVNLVTLLNYRDHRKIVVIDGKIGYTGGMNINDKYFLRWRDTHLRLTGGAVAGLQYLFLDTWLMAGGSLDRPVRDYFPQPESDSGKMVQIVPDDPQAELPWMGHPACPSLYLAPDPLFRSARAGAQCVAMCCRQRGGRPDHASGPGRQLLHAAGKPSAFPGIGGCRGENLSARRRVHP